MNDLQAIYSNSLLPPTQCNVCCSLNVDLCTTEKLYGKLVGKWPYIYLCFDCKAAVGCHPDTYIPLGLMANAETRMLRAKVHKSFDIIWRSGLVTRDQAYTWLADFLNISVTECHISWFNKETLLKIIPASIEYFEERKHAIDGRKAKRHEKLNRKHNSERKRIEERKKRR